MKLKWCKHEYVFIKNLYGYEVKSKDYNRSWWGCKKCGKKKGKKKSYHPKEKTM